MADELFKDDILDDAFNARRQERSAQRAELRRKKEIENERKKLASEKRKKGLKLVPFVAIIFAALVVLAGHNYMQIKELAKEKEKAQSRLNELEINIEKLNDELLRVTSDEYIEQQARTRLRMIYPGERLYVMLEDNQ